MTWGLQHTNAMGLSRLSYYFANSLEYWRVFDRHGEPHRRGSGAWIFLFFEGPSAVQMRLFPLRFVYGLKLCGQNARIYAIQRSSLGLESVRSEGFFRELAELRWMQSGTKSKVLAKTRYQRPPLVWIDTIRLTVNDKALMNVYSHNPHFDRYGRKRPVGIVFAKGSNVLDDCFELHRALFCPWRIDQVGCYGRQSGNPKFIRFVAIAHLYLVVRHLTAARQARQSIDSPDKVR